VSAKAAGRPVLLCGMSAFRVDGAATPAQLVRGFGNLSDRGAAEGIATVADLLR
jgi:GntR family transcriptional regulator/MocR family aminotransferase